MPGLRRTEHYAPCALLEEIVLAIHVDHAIFEDALPLVLDTGNLDR